MRLSPERANLREGSNSWHRAHLRQLAASPARRHMACVRTVSERTHESHDHLEPARTYLPAVPSRPRGVVRSEEHTSELQSRFDLVCRLLLEKKKKNEHYHE